MAEQGVTLDLDATHVTQHVASGGFDGSLLSKFPGNRISELLPGNSETESDAMYEYGDALFTRHWCRSTVVNDFRSNGNFSAD